jgi:hypothetical protein
MLLPPGASLDFGSPQKDQEKLMTALLHLPNSRAALQERHISHQLTWPGPALMLLARLGLFAGFQSLFAIYFALQGSAAPWNESIAWWPLVAVLTNFVSLGLLRGLLRREGMRLFDLYRVDRHVIWQEMLLTLGLFVVGGPLAMIPSQVIGNALFGDVALKGELMFRPLPQWAIATSLLFPLTIIFTELPIYFAYVMPRIEALTGRTWLAVLLPAIFLAAQHIALPLIFNPSFILWRFGMFLPFALFTGIVLRWRPRLLPYFMVIHGLMDLQIVFMIPAAL